MESYHYPSPIGTLQLTGSERGLQSIKFVADNSSAIIPRLRTMQEVIQQLNAYFIGERKAFDVQLDLVGTEFQLNVWEQLKHIAYGTTISYHTLSRRLNNPGAMRAVGAANGLNPVPIILPCHRVIGNNGSLTGYSGGLKRKQWLLEFENRDVVLKLF